ncbi:MAG: type I methionyl aminopeptidase [Gemmatimonadetes bacterium]|nr:type I methionyl aminopeptidase [Gemmatimonadota bacterium]
MRAIGRAGRILAELHEAIEPRVVPGATTAELDRFAEDFIRSHDGAEPAFKGLYGFPATLCTSINEEVVHGIPSGRRRLANGDIVSVDAGVRLDGWFADAARTFAAGVVDDATTTLLQVTQEALAAGIEQARAGNHMGDIGHAIQQVAEAAGFGVVRDLVGHGIGREFHEEPQVPNYGKPGRGLRLQAGLVIAIEPMINAGGIGIRTLPDRWTVVSADGSRSAHFEQTVAVTEGAPLVLTG